MESIIFNYIGYVLVFCSALCLVAPVVVHLISLIVGVVWKVVDEGDSEAPDLLKRVMPFLFGGGVTRLKNGKWAVYKGFGDFYEKNSLRTWSMGEYVLQYCAFDSKEEAEARSSELNVHQIKFEILLTLIAALSLLGLGFIYTPTITMYLLSSALCLLSLRWSRRGYKKVKKLKVALDEHAKDKAAHK
tara:strand:- start:5372 stop:5935 length:564 start_codon:yes stop_codon:yes gene_type:complete